MKEKDSCRTLGIYIHIPFCVRKCLYCDFLSAPSDLQTRERYVRALIGEMMEESRSYVNYKVDSVFLGGGTPSLLSAESIDKILQVVRDYFDVDEMCEISMEVNPGTVTLEKAMSWRKSGVNRLSIGLQSAIDEELKALGRIHTGKDFFYAYKTVVKSGFNNINVDLMSAIPGQTMASYRESLEKVIHLKPAPTHISAYSLIIEEGTPFYENRPVLPDEDLEREMYKITNDILCACGYHQYEISNYAMEGYECRHNQRYWRRENYVGFGIGAASMIENVRFQNTSDLVYYISCCPGCGGSIKGERQALSEKEQMEEFMFLGLRMTKGVSADEFFRLFGKTIDQIYPGIVEEFCGKGLLERIRDPITGEVWIALTRFGIDVSNMVMAQFLLS